jgi:hypothetical protein
VVVPGPLGHFISMQENPPAGLLAWIINVIAEKAPRGAFGVNIYVVNDDIVTINMWGYALASPRYKM